MLAGLFLDVLDDLLERIFFILIALLHAHHHVAVHLDEAAVAVVGEAAIAGLHAQRFDRLVVEAEVEDGVHHARHRVAGARAH